MLEPKTNYRTKIEAILQQKGLSQKAFLKKINKIFPDKPMAADHLSRIVSGRRKSFSTSTVYRFCKVLKKKPNQVLDFEDEI